MKLKQIQKISFYQYADIKLSEDQVEELKEKKNPDAVGHFNLEVEFSNDDVWEVEEVMLVDENDIDIV